MWTCECVLWKSSTHDVVVEKKIKLKYKLNFSFCLFTNKSESCHYSLQQFCNIWKRMNCNVKTSAVHSGNASVSYLKVNIWSCKDHCKDAHKNMFLNKYGGQRALKECDIQCILMNHFYRLAEGFRSEK